MLQHLKKRKNKMSELIKESEKPIVSFGEEFILWAEKYHRIENAYNLLKENKDEENCTYSCYREMFIRKINEMLKEKLNL